MKTWLTIGALLLACACATAPSGAAPTPSTTDLRPFSGQWTGTLMGPDMASVMGRMEESARLTLAENGDWTLSSKGVVASGVAHRTARGIVMDGRVISGDPMAVGRSVSFVLKPRGTDALYGEGQGFFLGLRINDDVLFKRQPA
jgi:hypothetical protein